MSAVEMRRGFSLIELMVVVTILGILAAIVLPRFASANQQATINAVSAITRNVQLKVSEHYAKHGSYPATIEGDWFLEGVLPTNPYDPNEGTTLIVQNIANKVYLQNKVAGSHIYWYNRATGAFHIRIPDQGSDAANLEYYNRVNHSDAASLSQTSR